MVLVLDKGRREKSSNMIPLSLNSPNSYPPCIRGTLSTYLMVIIEPLRLSSSSSIIPESLLSSHTLIPTLQADMGSGPTETCPFLCFQFSLQNQEVTLNDLMFHTFKIRVSLEIFLVDKM